MKVIRTRYLPFGNFAAINLCGVLFAHPGVELSAVDFNHELIHSRQIFEMLVVPFYVAYCIEWLVRIVQYRGIVKGYYNISFEREAYSRQHDLHYREHRPLWAWTRYLVKKKH